MSQQVIVVGNRAYSKDTGQAIGYRPGESGSDIQKGQLGYNPPPAVDLKSLRPKTQAEVRQELIRSISERQEAYGKDVNLDLSSRAGSNINVQKGIELAKQEQYAQQALNRKLKAEGFGTPGEDVLRSRYNIKTDTTAGIPYREVRVVEPSKGEDTGHLVFKGTMPRYEAEMLAGKPTQDYVSTRLSSTGIATAEELRALKQQQGEDKRGFFTKAQDVIEAGAQKLYYTTPLGIFTSVVKASIPAQEKIMTNLGFTQPESSKEFYAKSRKLISGIESVGKTATSFATYLNPVVGGVRFFGSDLPALAERAYEKGLAQSYSEEPLSYIGAGLFGGVKVVQVASKVVPSIIGFISKTKLPEIKLPGRTYPILQMAQRTIEPVVKPVKYLAKDIYLRTDLATQYYGRQPILLGKQIASATGTIAREVSGKVTEPIKYLSSDIYLRANLSRQYYPLLLGQPFRTAGLMSDIYWGLGKEALKEGAYQTSLLGKQLAYRTSYPFISNIERGYEGLRKPVYNLFSNISLRKNLAEQYYGRQAGLLGKQIFVKTTYPITSNIERGYTSLRKPVSAFFGDIGLRRNLAEQYYGRQASLLRKQIISRTTQPIASTLESFAKPIKYAKSDIGLRLGLAKQYYPEIAKAPFRGVGTFNELFYDYGKFVAKQTGKEFRYLGKQLAYKTGALNLFEDISKVAKTQKLRLNLLGQEYGRKLDITSKQLFGYTPKQFSYIPQSFKTISFGKSFTGEPSRLVLENMLTREAKRRGYDYTKLSQVNKDFLLGQVEAKMRTQPELFLPKAQRLAYERTVAERQPIVQPAKPTISKIDLDWFKGQVEAKMRTQPELFLPKAQRLAYERTVAERQPIVQPAKPTISKIDLDWGEIKVSRVEDLKPTSKSPIKLEEPKKPTKQVTIWKPPEVPKEEAGQKGGQILIQETKKELKPVIEPPKVTGGEVKLTAVALGELKPPTIVAKTEKVGKKELMFGLLKQERKEKEPLQIKRQEQIMFMELEKEQTKEQEKAQAKDMMKMFARDTMMAKETAKDFAKEQMKEQMKEKDLMKRQLKETMKIQIKEKLKVPKTIIKKGEFNVGFTLAKKLKKSKGFQAFIKTKGVFKKVGRVTSKGEAIRFGEKVARQTLSATFKIRESRGEVFTPSTEYQPSQKYFRGYKISGGQRIPLLNEWIQKRGTRLGTRGEVGEIMKAKRTSQSFFNIGGKL